MNALAQPRLRQTLDRLQSASSRDGWSILQGAWRALWRGRLHPSDMAKAYIAIAPETGRLLYTLARGAGAKTIVEYGTSFGISTIYLGAAAQDTGGRVITTEIEAGKVHVARQNLAEAGLAEIVEVWEGDALETLKPAPAPIDFLFMDSWAELYLPLLRLLEPKFRPGTLIVIDNARFPAAQPCIRYLRGNSSSYVSQSLPQAKGPVELSCFTA